MLTNLFKNMLKDREKIVKLPDKIKIENCLFISKYVNNKLPPIFNNWFIFSSTSPNYETSFAAKIHLKSPTVTTATFGKGAFISMATEAWNNIQSQIKNPLINTFSPNKLKFFLFDFYMNLYQTQGFLTAFFFLTFIFVLYYHTMTAKNFLFV